MNHNADTMFAVSSSGMLYRYTRATDTWTDLASGNTTLQKDWRGIGVNSDGTQMVAAAKGNGLWRSIDGGLTWATITDATVYGKGWTGAALTADGGSIFASAEGPGIFRSTDLGKFSIFLHDALAGESLGSYLT